MNLDPALLDILVCPACRSTLAVDEAAGELACTGCDRAYPVRDDIPVLLVDEARHRGEAGSSDTGSGDSGSGDSGSGDADTSA